MLKRRILASLLLVASLLGGRSEAAPRYINSNSLAAIGSLIEHEQDPERMMNLLADRRRAMDNLEANGWDQEEVNKKRTLDMLLELRQFAREGRCDNEVGDLIRATRVAVTWKPSLIGAVQLDVLIYYWTRLIAENCFDNVHERLLESRSRLNPTTVERVEGFLSDDFLDRFQASPIGDWQTIDWNEILNRFRARNEAPVSFGQPCSDFLLGMASQGALARAVIIRWPNDLNRPPSVKRTLMRIHFCELLQTPLGWSALRESMRRRP